MEANPAELKNHNLRLVDLIHSYEGDDNGRQRNQLRGGRERRGL